jgi:hypothetical protein
MKCINCEYYTPPDEDYEGGCTQDGDVSNPDEDLYCGAAGDIDPDWPEDE